MTFSIKVFHIMMNLYYWKRRNRDFTSSFYGDMKSPWHGSGKLMNIPADQRHRLSIEILIDVHSIICESSCIIEI